MAQLTQQAHTWYVSGEMVLETVSQLLEQSKALTLQADTQLDLSKVTDVDTSAVSLILEFQRRAKKESVRLGLLAVPEDLTSLIQLYGVDTFIFSN
ncbi:MAG TPA: STAS domain-containing protein [Methylophilus sp.]